MSDVSVVIPVRNGERYLGEAIESVLAQTHRALEVIVVDDGSDDRSAVIAAAPAGPMRVIEQPRLGVAAAVNRGTAEARGDHLAFIDADDLWTPRKLELQLEVLHAQPELDAVFGHALQFASPELPAATRARFRWRGEPAPCRARGTMLVRRRSLERFGPTDSRWRVGEFVDWYARASEAGIRAATIAEVILHRRLHEGNLGRNVTWQVDYARLARAALERRRARAR